MEEQTPTPVHIADAAKGRRLLAVHHVLRPGFSSHDSIGNAVDLGVELTLEGLTVSIALALYGKGMDLLESPIFVSVPHIRQDASSSPRWVGLVGNVVQGITLAEMTDDGWPRAVHILGSSGEVAILRSRSMRGGPDSAASTT